MLSKAVSRVSCSSGIWGDRAPGVWGGGDGSGRAGAVSTNKFSSCSRWKGGRSPGSSERKRSGRKGGISRDLSEMGFSAQLLACACAKSCPMPSIGGWAGLGSAAGTGWDGAVWGWASPKMSPIPSRVKGVASSKADWGGGIDGSTGARSPPAEGWMDGASPNKSYMPSNVKAVVVSAVGVVGSSPKN